MRRGRICGVDVRTAPLRPDLCAWRRWRSLQIEEGKAHGEGWYERRPEDVGRGGVVDLGIAARAGIECTRVDRVSTSMTRYARTPKCA